MTEKYTVGSKWTNSIYSQERETTVAAVVYVKHGQEHPDDLINYRTSDGQARRLMTAYRDRANRQWKKFEPKWEVGKVYKRPESYTAIKVTAVDPDGNAMYVHAADCVFCYGEGRKPTVNAAAADARRLYKEVQG